MKTKEWLTELFTYLLALLFLFAALSKLFDLNHFIQQMRYQVSEVVDTFEVKTVVLPSTTPTVHNTSFVRSQGRRKAFIKLVNSLRNQIPDEFLQK